MASIFEIKARIKGVESTQKITRSMKLVSTSKLHHIQGILRRFTPYSDNCRLALSMVASGSVAGCPLLERRSSADKVCYVAFVGNRGLCGSYNQDLLLSLRNAVEKEQGEYHVVLCGRWGSEAAADEKLRVLRWFQDISEEPTVEECDELADYLKGLYLDGTADTIKLLYQRHQQMGQLPTVFQLLPVERESADAGREYIFEPDRQALMQALSNMYVNASVRRVLLESKVSEHFARMTAMTSATDNADELLRQLSLTLNRTRQAKITTEINEIVGGAKALGKAEEHR